PTAACSALTLRAAVSTLAFFVTIPPAPRPALFPYTTLFRSYAGVLGGLTLNGTANLGAANASTNAQLYFQGGSQTLAGTGNVNLDRKSTRMNYSHVASRYAVIRTIDSGIAIQGGSGIVTGYY